MSTRTAPKPWFADVACVMLEERLDFLKACAVLGIPCDKKEAGDYQRRRAWKDLWGRTSQDFYERKANLVNHTKQAQIGRMLSDAERLRSMEKYKEASDVEMQAAKVQGWVGPDTTIGVFQDTSTLDLDHAIQKLKDRNTTVQ